MRSRSPASTGSTFSTETSARKQAERQLLNDAASGALQASSIDWHTAQLIAPALLTSQRIELRAWTEADRSPFAAMTANETLRVLVNYKGNHERYNSLGPCVEIGWRLAPQFWGLGLASEAARMALRAGFESLGLEEIVAITTLRNTRSRAVMQRLGMQKSPADEFDHPAFPPDHPERRCCVYRLTRARWSDKPLVSTQTQG